MCARVIITLGIGPHSSTVVVVVVVVSPALELMCLPATWAGLHALRPTDCLGRLCLGTVKHSSRTITINSDGGCGP